NRSVQAALEQTSGYTFFAGSVMANTVRASITMARNQDLAYLGALACALERYRLAKGKYPATLQDLLPQLMNTLPQDVIRGQAFRYSLKPDGTYLLYSVGWNERDDGGKEVLQAGGSKKLEEGDWVWQSNPK